MSLSVSDNEVLDKMNEEQILEIKTNGQYKNITLKDLDSGNYVFFTKAFEEGRKIESTKFVKPDGSPNISYSCGVNYGDDMVSFFLNERQYEAYRQFPQGAKIKVNCELKENTRKKGAFFKNLTFEQVE